MLAPTFLWGSSSRTVLADRSLTWVGGWSDSLQKIPSARRSGSVSLPPLVE